MSRPLGIAVAATVLAVLAAAPPAGAAWSVASGAVVAPVDSARVETRLDRRSADGLTSTEGTSASSPQTVLLLGDGPLVDVVNRSSVAAPLEITVTVNSIVSSESRLTTCSVPWTVVTAFLGPTTTTCSGTESVVGAPATVVVGSSQRSWRTALTQPGARLHLRLGSGVALLSRTTVTAVPKPAARDRSDG